MEGPHAEDEEADQLGDVGHKDHDDGDGQLWNEGKQNVDMLRKHRIFIACMRAHEGFRTPRRVQKVGSGK